MHFCINCHNMYYLKIRDDDDDNKGGNSLIYYCRNCGHEDNELTVTNLKVSVYEKTSNTQTHINSWIKFDPTLPHSHTIKCPNEKCKSNEPDNTSDVIYFRYDDIQMKYMYLCS